MKRRQLFEIMDQDWCPHAIRDSVTDYLQYVSSSTKPYTPVVPVIAAALQRSSARQVVDLGSGAGGPWVWLQPVLAEMGVRVSVSLTDKYPHLNAIAQCRRLRNEAIEYHPVPVEASRVPTQLAGFRTMFTAFHHFRPAEARAVLADAVRQRQGILVVEGIERSALAIGLMLLIVPLMVLIVTPVIRPFRWARLLWTYLLPLVPLVAVFDGLVSCMRTYKVEELRELVAGEGLEVYRWEIKSLKHARSPIPLTCLVGLPGDVLDPFASCPAESNLPGGAPG